MTLRVLVTCDGTPADRPSIPLGQCRAFLPLPMLAPAELAAAANAAGYRAIGGRHLCPSCVRSAGRCAHTSSMLHRGVRVCADCGEPRT